MKKIVSLIALAGMAGSAFAQPGTANYIDIKVRPYGSVLESDWTDDLTMVSPNGTDLLSVEVGAFYHRASGYGFATAINNFIASPWSFANGDVAQILDNAQSTAHPDGRIGNSIKGFNNGGQSQAIYTTNAVDVGRVRIAAPSNPTDNAAGGVSIKQNLPSTLGTDFDTSDGNFAYHFKLTFACYNNGAERTVTVDAPKAKINSYRVYDTSTSATATSVLASLLATDVAKIHVSWTVPAPASLALLGLGGLVVGRRRR